MSTKTPKKRRHDDDSAFSDDEPPYKKQKRSKDPRSNNKSADKKDKSKHKHKHEKKHKTKHKDGKEKHSKKPNDSKSKHKSKKHKKHKKKKDKEKNKSNEIFATNNDENDSFSDFDSLDTDSDISDTSETSNNNNNNSNNSKKESKKKNKKEKISLPYSAKTISKSDYYSKLTEFRKWLLTKKSCYLDDLSTKQAKRLFKKKFVKKWNSGKLGNEYYAGIFPQSLEDGQRTRFRWNFEKNMTDESKWQLAIARDKVDTDTNDINTTKIVQEFNVCLTKKNKN